MGFKVKILNMDAVLKKIEDLLDNDVRNKELMTDIGDFSKLRIQAETRLGKDITGKSVGKQRDLLPPTIRIRRAVKEGKIKPGNKFYFKPDGTFFQPSKSNLTATGQMLESLDGRVTKKGEVVVEPTGTRDASLQFDSGFKTNKALAKDLADRGRVFIGMDVKGIKRIKKLILDEVRRFKRRRGFK
jgi:hypothetical protein